MHRLWPLSSSELNTLSFRYGPALPYCVDAFFMSRLTSFACRVPSCSATTHPRRIFIPRLVSSLSLWTGSVSGRAHVVVLRPSSCFAVMLVPRHAPPPVSTVSSIDIPFGRRSSNIVHISDTCTSVLTCYGFPFNAETGRLRLVVRGDKIIMPPASNTIKM
jgi:hypothetical protein